MGDWCKYVGKEEPVYIGSLVYSPASYHTVCNRLLIGSVM